MSFKRIRNIFGRDAGLTSLLAGKTIGYSARQVSGVRLGALAPITGTGGTLLTPGNGYKYHVFTSSGEFSITPPGDNNDITYLLIGGGGGGGASIDAYAGAGGFVEGTATVFGEFPITITIGSSSSPAGNGNPTTIASNFIGTITAWGGGAGGSGSPSPPTQWIGTPGGSGGGGTRNAEVGLGNRQTGTATISGSSPVQGYPGFTFATLGGPGALSGGGGGAGGGGPEGSPAQSQNGGSGRAAFSGDTGIPPSYGTPGPTPGRWFGGGGAGDAGQPGVGGGGNPNGNGTANTGGGGGGRWPTGAGSIGGSGIVIIRYPT